jgi:uncharacterized protein YdhG (YjbR/CyaY superfamily)
MQIDVNAFREIGASPFAPGSVMTALVDAYLAALPTAQARALGDLRAVVAARLPGHIECLSYAMPGFRQAGLKGRMVVGYAAFKRHLGLYPHSGSVIPRIDCTPFKTSRSGVLFTPEHPLPAALVHKIIDLRLVELAAGYGNR